MHKTLKKYNKLKIKRYFKKQNILFLCSGVKSQTKNWVPVRKKLTNLGFKTYKVTNIITKEILINTKILKANSLFSGSVIFFKIGRNHSFKKLTDIKLPKLTVLAVKIKNNLYPTPWFDKIKCLNYFRILKKVPAATNNSLKLVSKSLKLTAENNLV